jgi:hypothetical protein
MKGYGMVRSCRRLFQASDICSTGPNIFDDMAALHGAAGSPSSHMISEYQ